MQGYRIDLRGSGHGPVAGTFLYMITNFLHHKGQGIFQHPTIYQLLQKNFTPWRQLWPGSIHRETVLADLLSWNTKMKCLPSDSKLISAAEYHLEEPTDLYDSSVSPTERRPITTTTRPNRSDNQLALPVHSLGKRLPASRASRHEQIH